MNKNTIVASPSQIIVAEIPISTDQQNSLYPSLNYKADTAGTAEDTPNSDHPGQRKETMVFRISKPFGVLWSELSLPGGKRI